MNGCPRPKRLPRARTYDRAPPLKTSQRGGSPPPPVDEPDRRTTDFRLLFGATIVVALGLAGMMAKGFHWLF